MAGTVASQNVPKQTKHPLKTSHAFAKDYSTYYSSGERKATPKKFHPDITALTAVQSTAAELQPWTV